jgi:hypothetical protein
VVVPVLVPDTIIFTNGSGSLHTASTTFPVNDAFWGKPKNGTIRMRINIFNVLKLFFDLRKNSEAIKTPNVSNYNKMNF